MKRLLLTAVCCLLAYASSANAAFVIQVDIDGMDDDSITFSPNFGFGGDTTTASQSSPSAAFGLTGDSIFGGDGSAVDTYVYTYDLDVDGDNLAIPAGTALNGTNSASGLAAGGTATYNVFATWPFTENVSGGNTTYTLTDDLANTVLNVSLDQNGQGNDWVLLGSADLDAARSYTLTQESGAATFVSMRAAGVLFEPVPEPNTFALLGLCGLALAAFRRR